MKLSTLGASWIAGLGAVAACGGESSSEADSACHDPVCCAPVDFDRARSRAYRVGDRIELYLATRGEVYAPQPSLIWLDEGQFDAQVSARETESVSCDNWTDTSAAGLNGKSCTVAPISDVACGQEITFQVDLRSTLRHPDTHDSLCTAAPFTTQLRWTTVVACPECDPEVFDGAGCDHPAALECSYINGSGGPFCGPDPFPCTCQTDVSTGERQWRCAVC